MRIVLITFSRQLGRQVCRIKGHDYYSGQIEVNSYSAYRCIRCGKPDKSPDNLSFVPSDEYGYMQELSEFEIAEKERARRWISWLPCPKWL